MKTNILPIQSNIVNDKHVAVINTHVINCANGLLPIQWLQKKQGLRQEVSVNCYSLGLCMLPCIAQGHARDFTLINKDGSFDDSDDFIGVPVYAINDGIVVAIEDGHIVGETIDCQEKAAGNYVLIKHESGYALYAHLDTGSIRVQSGNKVQRGQIIGKVGNTGNSTGPHLHFQLTYNDPRILGWFGGIAKKLSGFESYESVQMTWNEYFEARNFKTGLTQLPKLNDSGEIASIEIL